MLSGAGRLRLGALLGVLLADASNRDTMGMAAPEDHLISGALIGCSSRPGLQTIRSKYRHLGAPFLLHFHPSDYLSASAPRSKFLRSGTPVSSYRFHRFSERDFSRARQLLGSRKRRGSNGLPAVERSIVPVAAEQLAAQKVKHLSVAPLSKRTTC